MVFCNAKWQRQKGPNANDHRRATRFACVLDAETTRRHSQQRKATKEYIFFSSFIFAFVDCGTTPFAHVRVTQNVSLCGARLRPVCFPFAISAPSAFSSYSGTSAPRPARGPFSLCHFGTNVSACCRTPLSQRDRHEPLSTDAMAHRSSLLGVPF